MPEVFGMLANRRDFATLPMGNGDGSAVDSQGRLYVTSNPGVQVFDKTGKYLGLIPTPPPEPGPVDVPDVTPPVGSPI